MSWSSRRAAYALAAVALLGVLSIVGIGHGQKRPPGAPPVPGGPPGTKVKDTYDLGNLVLPKDEDLKERVEAAQDNIKNATRAERDGKRLEARGYWERACDTLHKLLLRPEDIFVPLSRTDGEGRESIVYVSVKKEASRLIGALPKEGRQFYEATYGPKARTDVDQAKKNSDFPQMGRAFALYLHTDAGADAGMWLGTYMLDRADFQGASRFYQQLLERNGFTGLKDKTLLKAAFAFNAAGDKPNYDKVMEELQRRGSEFKLEGGAEARTVADLRDTFGKMGTMTVSITSATDSPMYRGREGRTALMPGGAPFLEPAWRKAMASVDATKSHLRNAEDNLRASARPVLSGFMPVTATADKSGKKVQQLVFRTHKGIMAVNAKTGELSWDAENPWSLDEVFANAARDPQKSNAYSQWISAYNRPIGPSDPYVRPQMLLENSAMGTLTADNRHVYAIEDLPVPPPAAQASAGGVLGQAIGHNKLLAYSMAKGGRIAWEAGSNDSKDPLGDTYFLAAPLPLNGKLYVLGEKQQELRLICLDPAGDGKGRGKVLAIQPLASTKNVRMMHDPLRRTQAAHLSYGEGIMVVPTNAGAVFGVDILANSLLWAYPYRETTAPPAGAPMPPGGFPPGGFPPGGMPGMAFGTMNASWQVTAPVVSNGRVVFTAPDGRNIHCVNLRDGSRVWHSAGLDNDLYLAGVFNGKVVVVGRKATRALNLKDGSPAWEIDTGEPSGQGAASNTGGNVLYYLPIRSSIATKEPEILTIDVDRGVVHAHTRSRKKEIPGNLLFFEGAVISQSHTEVVAYPQLEVQLARLDKEVAAKPDDAALLTERGDYLLDKGDLPKAIADLRKALANKPEPAVKAKARGKLYDAFTEIFQKDFAKGEPFLKEYEEMCVVDLEGKVGAERTALIQEGRSRRANFLCLVGKGREKQGRLVEAFERYLELGETAKADELIQVVDEPSVKAAPDVWTQGRFVAMVTGAAEGKQKAELEALIKGKWEKAKASGKKDDLRKFVSLFGSLFGVGREARFALAEKLMDDSDLNSLLEAEQQLTLLRNDSEDAVAARAVEALARLNTSKGLLEDAAHYYRVLGEKHPEAVVSGKKGKEWLADLAADKRFLPYLDEGTRFTVRGKVKLNAIEKPGMFATSFSYGFANLGEKLPYFLRNRISLKLDWISPLEITDTATGEKRQRQLDRTNFSQIANLYPTSTKTQFGYQTLGHAVVIQLGHRVFGIDPLGKEPRVLWSRNLSQLPGSDVNPPAWSVPSLDPRDGAVQLLYTDGSMQRLGSGSGPLQGGVVCLLRRDSLTAIDPVTGRELWVRTDIGSRATVFGDGQNVYVVGLGESGQAAGTRAFRASDGVSVKIKDFSPEFDGRNRLMGRTIFTKETNPRGETTLKLYDVLEGKAVWTEKFGAGTLALETSDPDLVGAVDPTTGAVRVMSLKTRKDVFVAKVDDPKHAAGAQSAALVADPDYVFVAFKMPDDPNVVTPWGGGVQSSLQPGLGLRSAPVNGMVYAFDRATGKRKWYFDVPHAHLTLTGAEDAPALHFTSRFQKWSGPVGAPGRTGIQYQGALSIAKHNGMLWFNDESVPAGMNFHEYTVDQRTGTMELIGGQKKYILTLRPAS